MSGATSAVKALAAVLASAPALAAFTITDRPANPGALPHIRIGPLEEKPWATGSSLGAELAITLHLTSRSGSFAQLRHAADAVSAAMETPLSFAGGASVVQRVDGARFFHEPAHDLERASLSLVLLIDLGDAPTP